MVTLLGAVMLKLQRKNLYTEETMDEIVATEIKCKKCGRFIRVIKYASGAVVGECICGNKPTKKKKKPWFVR